MSRKMVYTIGMAVCAVILFAAVLSGVGGIARSAGLSYADADKYTVGGGEIREGVRNLDIHWVAGKVRIEYDSGETIRLRETSPKALGEDLRMRWRVDGDVLRVQFEKPGLRILRFGVPEKELTLTLPEGMAFGDVSISATSGDLDIPALQAERLSLSTTSGDVTAAAEVRQVSAGATSGDIRLTLAGSADKIDAGTTSGYIGIRAGNVEALSLSATSGALSVTADQVKSIRAGTTSGDIHADIADLGQADFSSTSGSIAASLLRFGSCRIGTTSGGVSLSLPEEPGFTARIGTVSGSVTCDLPLSKQGSTYRCGDGSQSLDISTTSGSVRIGRNSAE